MSINKFVSGFTIAGAVSAIALAMGCSQTSAKAPETPGQHRAAAAEELQKAEEHQEAVREVTPSKPNAEENQRSQHQQEANAHTNRANEHEIAAEHEELQQ